MLKGHGCLCQLEEHQLDIRVMQLSLMYMPLQMHTAISNLPAHDAEGRQTKPSQQQMICRVSRCWQEMWLTS